MSAPILILAGGVALLALFSVYFLHRRAVGVAAAKRDVDEQRDVVLKTAQQSESQAIHDLLEGRPPERVFPDYLHAVRSLLPCSDPEHVFTVDDLRAEHRRWLEDRIDAVNRKLLLPVSIAFISVVAATLTLAYVSYLFSSAPPPLPAASPYPAPISGPPSQFDFPPLEDPPVLNPQPPPAVPPQAEPEDDSTSFESPQTPVSPEPKEPIDERTA